MPSNAAMPAMRCGTRRLIRWTAATDRRLIGCRRTRGTALGVRVGVARSRRRSSSSGATAPRAAFGRSSDGWPDRVAPPGRGVRARPPAADAGRRPRTFPVGRPGCGRAVGARCSRRAAFRGPSWAGAPSASSSGGSCGGTAAASGSVGHPAAPSRIEGSARSRRETSAAMAPNVSPTTSESAPQPISPHSHHITGPPRSGQLLGNAPARRPRRLGARRAPVNSCQDPGRKRVVRLQLGMRRKREMSRL